MELVLDENGHAVIEDGKLLFKQEDGQVVALTAGDIEATRAEAATAKAERDKLASDLRGATIFSAFAGSRYRHERMVAAFDPETAMAAFGHHFKVEDGRIVGYDRTGERIFSRSRPGELADFDESLELLCDQHPNQAFRRLGNSGGGSFGGGHPSAGGSASRVAQIASPTDRITAARKAGITT